MSTYIGMRNGNYFSTKYRRNGESENSFQPSIEGTAKQCHRLLDGLIEGIISLHNSIAVTRHPVTVK